MKKELFLKWKYRDIDDVTSEAIEALIEMELLARSQNKKILERPRAARGGLQYLRRHADHSLPGLHPLSRRADRAHQAGATGDRSLRDLPVDRRHVHSVHHCGNRRRLGLVHLRRCLGIRLCGDPVEGLLVRADEGAIPVGLPGDGLDGGDHDPAVARQHSFGRCDLACRRRPGLYGRRHLLRLGKAAPQPRDLASFCHGG